MPEPPLPDAEADRRRWMAILARASAKEIEGRLRELPLLPAYTRLRGPECGLVMVQGRIGGGGGAFNLGEMTVTRCTVRTASGRVGHAYVAGRNERQAELAAVLDATLQDPDRASELHTSVLEPLAQAQRERAAITARKAAATRVEFFTMTNMRS